MPFTPNFASIAQNIPSPNSDKPQDLLITLWVMFERKLRLSTGKIRNRKLN